MKRLVVLFAFFTLFSSQTIAQNYGLDNADPALFTKFKIPDTDLHSLWFNTNFNYLFNKMESLPQVGANSDNTSSGITYSLSPQYYLLKESESRYLSINATANGNYSSSRNSSEGPSPYSLNQYTKDYNGELKISANEVYRDYWQDDAAFYSVGSNASLDIYGNHDDMPVSDSTRRDLYTDTKSQIYGISFGIGWGKMRNVTPVVSAIRFQQRLKQLNLLNKDLSESTIEDLAQQFYREGYFSDVHVRPDKFFWQDVQKTLSRDGVSLAGLNQYADSYIREVPNELRFMRNEGIVGGIDIIMSYTNSYGRNAYPYGTEEQFLAQGNAYLQYSHQLDLNSQFNFNISLSGGPNLSRNPQLRQAYAVNADAGYDYELTDRLVFSLDEALKLAFNNSTNSNRNLQNAVNAAATYFVEDNISLTASYSWNYSDYEAYSYWGNITNVSHVVVALTYYVDRGLMLN